MGTGHLPDLTIVTPMFRDDRLMAFVGSIAPSPDREAWDYPANRARSM
jgi:N-methylhydantoinase B/oxoprolinase/acetone carboxylase alpha subunit